MAREKVVRLRRPAPERERDVAPRHALPPGTHFGRLEARDREDRFRFRASGGELVSLRLGEGFESSFAEECIKNGRIVLSSIGADGEGVAIGALQTSSTAKSDVARLEAR